MAIPTAACLVPSCAQPVPVEAPLDLCEPHLARAAEWATDRDGRTDLLPGACRSCGSRLGIRFPAGWLCAVCEWRVGDVLDDELPPPRIDVVYYLRFEDRVKIGTTVNPRRRLARIRHHELLAFERGGRLLEHRRHEQFADDRFTPASEWFRRSAALTEHLAVVTAGVEDPWQLHARWVGEVLALRG